MVKFARSGGEPNAIAVRLARAASGKDGVAVCVSWLARLVSVANLNSIKLDGHLLCLQP